jgi:actin-related protein
MDLVEQGCVVLDAGSSTFKIGFAGNDSPRVVFSSIVGCRRHHVPLPDHKVCYCGDRAQSVCGFVILRHPISFGIIKRWNDFSELLKHGLNVEMRVAPEEHVLLLTEPPLSAKGSREKLVELAFLSCNVPAVCVVNAAVLSMYGAGGGITGMVVLSGEGATWVVPVIDGKELGASLLFRNVCGFSITFELRSLLKEQRCYSLVTTAEWEIVRHIKQTTCFVKCDDKNNCEKDCDYEMPCGTMLSIGSERWQCVEAMFSAKTGRKNFAAKLALKTWTLVSCF